MRSSCSSVSKLLERYFDQEVTGEERSLIRDHLSDCATCQETLRSMDELRDLMRAPVEEAVGKEDFPWVWQKIERGIQHHEKTGWWETIRLSIIFSPILRKKVWVPAMAALAILILVAVPLLFKESPSYPDSPVVEYVESQTHNVMIYQVEKAKMTVIWFFEGPELERSAS